jgi:hypothetical protein
MHDVLSDLFQNAPTIGDRHLPAPPANGGPLPLGSSCFYLNRGKRRRGRDGFRVECVAYVSGLAPEQTTTDFAATSLPITATQIVDPTTRRPRQVVHTYRVLFFGQCAIVEVEKGGGGVALLEQCLSSLIQRHVDEDLPKIQLIDVVGANLRKSIIAAGGVAKISARLATAVNNRRRPFSFRLSRLKQWAGPRSIVHAEIDFPDGDNAAKGLGALDEYAADSGLDSVTLHLRDGQKINSLGKYSEKRRLDIRVNPAGGGLNVTDIEDALWNYLDEVRVPDEDGWRIIDDQGRPAAARLIDDDEG